MEIPNAPHFTPENIHFNQYLQVFREGMPVRFCLVLFGFVVSVKPDLVHLKYNKFPDHSPLKLG